MMRTPHTIRFTRSDGSQFDRPGYAELVDDSGFTAEGVRPRPRIEAILPPKGYGSVWTIQEGDRMEVVQVAGIKGVVSQVRPITSARTRTINHVEITAG